MSFFGQVDPQLQIARGKVPGQREEKKAGVNPAIGSGITEDIWSAATAQLVWPTAAVQMDIVSTDANDTAAGTGARVVAIFGLDANFDEPAGNAPSELIALDGLTPVTTVNSYIRINRTVIAQSGTYGATAAGANIGTITVQVTGGGDVQDIITPESGTSEKSHWTVANGKTGYVTSLFTTLSDNVAGDIHLYRRNNADIVAAPFSATIRTSVDQLIESQNLPFFPPLKLSGKSDIWMVGVGGSAGAAFNTVMQLIIIDD